MDIVQTFTYDGSGRQLAETITGGDISRTTEKRYHKTGQLAYSIDATGLRTDYEYQQGGRISVVTQPGNIISTTENHLDGRVKSTTGNGVVPRYYTYGCTQDGEQWTQVNTGSPSSPLWEKTTQDMLGRTIRMEKPGFAGTAITTNVYNNKGRLIKTTTTGQADTLYEYDEPGDQIRSGLDIDGSSVLENGSRDRISETQTLFVLVDGAWWQQTEQNVYATDENATVTTIATQRTRLTGLGNGLVAESVSIDIHGNQTISKTILNRDTRTETSTVDYPDSDTDAVSITTGNLLVSSTSKTGLTTTFEYDGLGRRTGVTDPRTGKATTHYNQNGRVDYLEDAAGNRTTYSYDPATGRKVSEINALNKVTRLTYNDRGQVTHTWGDATYPVKYIFDAYGRMVEMHTFRNGTNWNNETWPTGQEGSADITKWRFHEASGLLKEKEDAAGKIVSYTYENGARLHTRTWARRENSNPVVTTYGYDPHTGELLAINYSDSTPAIGFTYDRLGRQHTITDALGSRIFAYNTNLQLESESITGLMNKTITRAYATDNVVGRPTGFNTGSDYSVIYGYDSFGRYKSVGWHANATSGMADYTYMPISDWLESMTTLTGQKVTYSYEPNRPLRTQIKNETGTTIVSQYDYQYDALGRRSDVKNSGTAFGIAAFNKFGYDDRNQVTESSRYTGTNIDDLTNPVPAEYRGYDYDPIGNRKTATVASATDTYTANPLNQYTQVAGAGSQSLGYDFDGNLTDIVVNGVGQKLTYNAENRLTIVESTSPADGSTKVEFVYDYLGRRIKKFVFNFSSGSWLLTSEYLFLYDSWNLIEETKLSGPSESTRYFVWGLDLSQSLQGAGGIGGLIEVIDGSSKYQYFYDGNGNVGQLVNAANGAIAAHYEYDPYGNLTNAVGDYASQNPYKFSTKMLDSETGFYYYMLRYYSAELGRWLNRDPNEENGGMNLYLFVRNTQINLYDFLGLTTVGDILDSYFSDSTSERLWIMPEHDEYTRRVRAWSAVQDALKSAKTLLEKNCNTWQTSHMTDPSWQPGPTDPPATDPNAWGIWVNSPAGTDPATAGSAYSIYLISNRQIDALWTSAIGSFGIYVTVDEIDCCKKICGAKLQIWMYNSMDRDSFGVFADSWFFRKSGQARQYMWWNWKEKHTW